MSTWTEADHPRGDGGRFKAKTRTEPESGLDADSWVSTPTTASDGSVHWRTPDRRTHRVDGPAIIWPDGSQSWHYDNEIHREDGPAIIRANGHETWMRHGKPHRIGGPAVTKLDGGQEWWQDGKRHRTDGPAAIFADGTRAWFIHDQLHRTDGPAVINSDGSLEWYENDVRKTPEVEAALTMMWHARTPSVS